LGFNPKTPLQEGIPKAIAWAANWVYDLMHELFLFPFNAANPYDTHCVQPRVERSLNLGRIFRFCAWAIAFS
jgi:hypothetical protein